MSRDEHAILEDTLNLNAFCKMLISNQTPQKFNHIGDFWMLMKVRKVYINETYVYKAINKREILPISL